jgi:hypothetical protein
MMVGGVDSNQHGGGEAQNYHQNRYGRYVLNQNIHPTESKEQKNEKLSPESHGVYPG